MSKTALVLLYNKIPSESKTIQSLIQSDINLSLLSFLFWNNGPSYWSERDISFINTNFPNCSITETIDNKSLSFIYNSFVTTSKANYFLIFDDDSSLSNEYLHDAVQYHNDGIAAPVISCKGQMGSPVQNGSFTRPPYQKDKTVFLVGSGLIINSNIIQILISKYGEAFDSSFGFYGVDTSFCDRLSICGLSECISVISGFEHSLSQFEDETIQKKKFRKKETGIAYGILFRRYPERYPRISFFKILLNSLLKKNNYSIYYLIYGFLRGCHPKTIIPK